MENKIIPCDEVNDEIDVDDYTNCQECDTDQFKYLMIKCENMYFCQFECLAEYYNLSNEVLKVISENYKKEK